jgi:HTH-type transcriptional regulator / antitoxin HigA
MNTFQNCIYWHTFNWLRQGMGESSALRIRTSKVQLKLDGFHPPTFRQFYTTKMGGKMPLTFDQNAYGSLLLQYQPKLIQSEEENEAAIALATELEHCANLTTEESAPLDLLVTLLEQCEAEHYPIPQSSPLDMLMHLMESRECKQEDLICIIGSCGAVAEVVNGKRSISKVEAKALAEYFNVDVGFLSDGTHL